MDLSHELGALRFVVDSPLSSKVAMFNQQVSNHKQGQLLNPFATPDGRSSPKPTFSKDEYGKPLAGSLTEARGQKANMHVLREMLELCQIIDSEGYNVKDEPHMRVIPFGELFNIYNYISDKCVGICLRARKHKLIEFEGEMLFQRRDDDVPIFLLRPIHEIRHELQDKIECIKRCGTPEPQATSILLDKKGLQVRGATPNSSRSGTPKSTPKSTPSHSKASTPIREIKPSTPTSTDRPKIQIQNESKTEEVVVVKSAEEPAQAEIKEVAKTNGVAETQPQPQLEVQLNLPETPAPQTEVKPDVNNNQNADLPTIVIEATAVHPATTSEAVPTPELNSVAAEPSAVPAETAASA